MVQEQQKRNGETVQVRISEELHRLASAAAALAGVTQREFIDEALRDWIAEHYPQLIDS